MAIARGNFKPDTLIQTAGILRATGLGAIEVTLDSPGALDLIRHLSQIEDQCVGAGTVLAIEQAMRAIEAGAEFLVCPHTDPELVNWAAARGVPILPGALTPTEVITAWNAGAAAVKVFPADTVGPAYISALRKPLSCVALVPTGGIDARNAPAYIAAGAVAVGVGSWLTAQQDHDTIAQRARELGHALARP